MSKYTAIRALLKMSRVMERPTMPTIGIVAVDGRIFSIVEPIPGTVRWRQNGHGLEGIAFEAYADGNGLYVFSIGEPPDYDEGFHSIAVPIQVQSLLVH
ncbi:MAG: hypothetical protein UY41_C0011G0009 [Candidatus Moranbacteria bacterium GW2011_GWE1_49_15]|nr:MAG: hypothetical protein UX75_C0030G0009 [Candidatus Moranbacteria bacterium GW2011_GWE2_47_10]KKW06952.1 MAG: hypothetical protein UY41_C0011G0009 [Candidatus Moranbacteria bacterium GW2011_GWE1_49_15]HBP01405.1 hypothetical protein [Candidatus Moranbacteria bacterium]